MQLSVVIPALNEAAYLPRTLKALRERAAGDAPMEVLVADCASKDETAALARAEGATVIERDPPFESKAEALNAGAAAAKGDTLFFLDADSLPPAGYPELIREALAKPGASGGAFSFAFEGRGFGLRLVEFINRVRYRLWPLYYSDQGLFLRSEVFRRVGGYPARGIMESSDMCRALHREGKLVLVNRHMLTSPRRFLEEGVYRVLAHDARIWWRDLTGRETETYAAAYRENNRQRGGPEAVEQR